MGLDKLSLDISKAFDDLRSIEDSIASLSERSDRLSLFSSLIVF